MYQRKTRNAEELSAALRRASLSRKNRRGGRPKKENRVPPNATAAIDKLDLLVLKNKAKANGRTLKGLFHILAAGFIMGGRIEANPALKPEGWKK